MQPCILRKKKKKTTCYIYRLSFLVKDNTTLGKAEEISEKQESLFHTVNLWKLLFARSRGSC